MLEFKIQDGHERGLQYSIFSCVSNYYKRMYVFFEMFSFLFISDFVCVGSAVERIVPKWRYKLDRLFYKTSAKHFTVKCRKQVSNFFSIVLLISFTVSVAILGYF